MSAASVPKRRQRSFWSSSDGTDDSDDEHIIISRRASGQSQPQTEHEKKEKERMLMFTKVLMRYLEQRDPEMHTKAKAVIKECYERHKMGDPAYKSLAKSMITRLQATVGETRWNKAEHFHNQFLILRQKQKAKLGQTGGNNPQPKPPPQKMIPQQQQPPVITNNQQVATPQKEMDVFLSAARRKKPFKSSRASGQSQSEAITINHKEEEEEEKERYFMVTRCLMAYLKERDPEMHTKAKALMNECYEKKTLGDPACTSLMQIMKTVRATVGETYWKGAQDYFNDEQKQIARPGGQSGGNNPQPKPPPQKMIPRQQQQQQQQPPVIFKNQRVATQQKTKKGHLNTQSKRASKTSTKANGREVAAKGTEIEQLQFTIAQLRGNLEQKDKEIALMKEILKQIGLSTIDQYKKENDALKEQLKHSKPIEVIEIEQSSGDDSHDGEPPSKRHKSNLAITLEQTQQMVKVKEEANQRAAAAEATVEATRREKDAVEASLRDVKEQSQQMMKVKKEAFQRAAAAEANAETARREKDAVEASLRDVQEDLEDANEVVTQQTLTTDIWQGRFDEVFELARKAGVDGKRLSEIRYRPLSSGS